MTTHDIGALQLASLYALILLPWGLLEWLGLRIARDLLVALLRMSIQLGLIGIYLKVLFDLNHPWLNGLWILVMLIAADLSILRRAGLHPRIFFLSTLTAVSLAVLFTAGYLIVVAIRPGLLYDARYMVPLVGMILGNCLQGNVIALERFFTGIRGNQNEYLTYLLLGATRREAVRPFARDAVKAALNPTLAGMATMGLVSLPGMMTGQILGGGEPWIAVKYQIAIMLCIFTGTALAAVLNLRFSLGLAFDAYDRLREDALRQG